MKEIEDKKDYKPYKEDEISNVDIDIDDFDIDINKLTEEDLIEKNISYVERQIRNSFEYREYINYLKSELNLTKCSLLDNIDIKDLKVSLEFHHYPLNLYEITEIVAKKLINDKDMVSTFDIAEEVDKLHYRNMVGLVPLTKTIHEMAHSKTVMIPLDKVNGDYKKFLKEYDNFVPEEIKERIQNVEKVTQDQIDVVNKNKLKKKILNYNINYNKENNEE